jgi:hypothetical protein
LGFYAKPKFAILAIVELVSMLATVCPPQIVKIAETLCHIADKFGRSSLEFVRIGGLSGV